MNLTPEQLSNQESPILTPKYQPVQTSNQDYQDFSVMGNPRVIFDPRSSNGKMLSQNKIAFPTSNPDKKSAQIQQIPSYSSSLEIEMTSLTDTSNEIMQPQDGDPELPQVPQLTPKPPQSKLESFVPEANVQPRMLNLNQKIDYQLFDQGDYEGQKDQNGIRLGKGKCTWIDGSVYDGDWANNMRHGFGEFKRSNGEIYQGYWVNDQKHSNGTLQLPDGTKIEAKWEKDRIHGEGVLTDKNKNQHKCIWHYDLMIPLNKKNSGQFDKAPLNFILSASSLIFLVASYIQSDANLLAAAIVIYIIQLIEVFVSPTFNYLKNTESAFNTRQIIDNMRRKAPQIEFTIQNYHYELRTRVVIVRHRVTSNSGRKQSGSRNEMYWHKVNTHYSKEAFKFSDWADLSPMSDSLDYAAHIKLARLEIKDHYEFSTDASASFEWQKQNFLCCNHRDSHYEFSVNYNVPDLRRNILLFQDSNGPQPWFSSQMIFITLSVWMLGWIQRIALVKNSQSVTYKLHKFIMK